MAIIRGAVKCLTCDHAHTVRIGMGQEETQEHKFACRNCSEEIVVHLDVDYQNISAGIRSGKNAEVIEEVAGAPIVNLDANFLVPDSYQGKDMVFPRLSQVREQFLKAEAEGRLVNLAGLTEEQRQSRPYRRPDFSAEWQKLRKAWSLTQNEKEKLAKRQIETASQIFYSDEPLKNLPDWLWRFGLFFSQPSYETKFREAWESIEGTGNDVRMRAFHERYDREMSIERGKLYFATMKDFFAHYSEYAQVYFSIVREQEIPGGSKASSSDFDAIKMIYGNLYEAFGSLVELLAMLNNMKLNRDHDQFETLTLEAYRRLDKSSRLGPFTANAPFLAICEEFDNQLRNASHHGGMAFDASTQIITYRAGKGGQGEVKTLSYIEYLCRCVRLFLQVVAVLRIELILCNNFKMRHPL